jgi:hypothetical protein
MQLSRLSLVLVLIYVEVAFYLVLLSTLSINVSHRTSIRLRSQVVIHSSGT